MTGRYLASWGEAEETGPSERGEGGRGGRPRQESTAKPLAMTQNIWSYAVS